MRLRLLCKNTNYKPNFITKLVKVPAVPVAAIPSSTVKPIPVNHRSGIPAVQHHNKSTTRNEDATREWDGWPDGVLERDFTWKEFEATGQLMSQKLEEGTG